MKKIYKIYFIVFVLMICSDYTLPQITIKDGIAYRNIDSLNFKTQSITKQLSSDQSQTGSSIIPPTIVEDFYINTPDGEYGAAQRNSCAAKSKNGYSAVVWMDERNGTTDIYAQFFNPSGNKIGTNIKVNDYPYEIYGNPFIAVNNTGRFVIGWTDRYQGILVQIFDTNGNRVSNNIAASYGYTDFIIFPSIAVSNDGSFLVMWSYYYSGDYSIYARRFQSNGTPSGNEIKINDDDKRSTSYGGGKFISVDQEGNYIICWSSNGNTSTSNIYLQTLDSNGNKFGSNLLVSEINYDVNCYFPEITTTSDGYSLIIWSKQIYNQPKSGVGGRIFKMHQQFITSEFNVSEPDSWGDLYKAVIENDSSFLVVTASSASPYFQRINKNGQFVGTAKDLTFNTNKILNFWDFSLSNLFDNELFISITASNRSDENIYRQKFDQTLLPVGDFILMNDDQFSSAQKYPYVKFNSYGRSLVLWEDRKNGRGDLYAQVLDQNFNPVSGNIKVNDYTGEYFFLHSKKIKELSDGSFVIVFSGSTDIAQNQIWLQKISDVGEKIGNNISVRSINDYYYYSIGINTNSDDEILAYWYNDYGAYMRKFDKNLNPKSNEIRFITSITDYYYSPLEISCDTSLTLFASYKLTNSSTYEHDRKLFGSFYNSSGNVIQSSFIIDSMAAGYGDIVCCNNGLDYAIIYPSNYYYKLIRNYSSENNIRYTTNFSIYAYNDEFINIHKFENKKLFLTYSTYRMLVGKFFNDNKRESAEYDINIFNYYNIGYYPYQKSYAVDLYEDKLFTVFEDFGNIGNNIDIKGNVKSAELINFNKEAFYPRTNKDFIYNNFPNPFNSSTKIVYELIAYHKVKLTVYDILGREVKVLVDEAQEKGLHEVNLDANNLASGVYLLRLDAFDTTVKKIVVLK